MTSKSVYIKTFLVLLLLIWCAGIFSPVLFRTAQSKLFSDLYLPRIYSLVCHREDSKSFFVEGNKLEVCARCTGIYAGALLFSIVALVRKIRPRTKKLLYAAFVLMAADVLSYSIGIYSYSKWIALITGLILGSVSILYIFDGIEEYFSELKMSPDVQ